MLEVRGEIDGPVFVVAVLGERVSLDTAEVSSDERGDYALVRECIRELRDGFKLKVELEPDDDGFHGVVVHLFAESEASRNAAKSRLRSRGIEPDAAQLLGVLERSFGVHFDHWGKVNGRSWMSKANANLEPPERPS